MKLKNKFSILIIVLCIFYLFEKTKFVKNLINTYYIDEEKRIENLYGFCGGESIGYLKYVNKKLDFKSNPKIVNYEHTPQNLWAIYNTNYIDNNDTFILLNYPGKEITLNLDHTSGNFFELKDTYFYSTISTQIKFLYVNNPNLSELKIEFYELDSNNSLQKIKTFNLKKNRNEENFQINQNLNEFNLNEKNLFVKLNNTNFSEIKIIFENKFILNEYKILDQYNNCYVIRK